MLTTFFAVCGAKYSGIVGNCLKSLAELRSSANFTFTNELDYVIGKAVRTMGPEVVLSHVPLQITGKEESFEFPRSWLLPVLRENIQKANLAFFKSYFLPIAQSCDQRVKIEDDKIGKKSYELIVNQIWALLPGFCNNPKDFNVAFDQVVNDMGRNLLGRKDLRMYIMASLRQLLLKTCCDDTTEAESNVAILSKYADKFLKNLYDLYIAKPLGAEEAGQRMSIMETIKLFLPLVNDTGRQGLIFDTVRVLNYLLTSLFRTNMFFLNNGRSQSRPRSFRLSRIMFVFKLLQRVVAITNFVYFFPLKVLTVFLLHNSRVFVRKLMI